MFAGPGQAHLFSGDALDGGWIRSESPYALLQLAVFFTDAVDFLLNFTGFLLRPAHGDQTMCAEDVLQQQQRQSLALVACMHRNGFPQFPDNWSQWKSGNIGMLVSAGIDPKSPQLNAAFTKCGSWG